MSREVRAQAVLETAGALLGQGRVNEALAALRAGPGNSDAANNAVGVCQLRLGQHEMAMWTFRQLVFPNDALVMPRQTPAAFVANYALAHLLMGNAVTGVSMLGQHPDRHHPAIAQVRGAVARWKRSMPWWRRALTLVGAYPPGAPPLDFAPGFLWPEPQRAAG